MKPLIKILLLILFFPLWLLVWLLTILIFILMFLLDWIPLIGLYIHIALSGVLAVLYPVLTIYGIGLVSFGEEEITFNDSEFRIKSKFKDEKILWNDVASINEVFCPPVFTYDVELKSGLIIKFNVATDLAKLKTELENRNIPKKQMISG